MYILYRYFLHAEKVYCVLHAVGFASYSMEKLVGKHCSLNKRTYLFVHTYIYIPPNFNMPSTSNNIPKHALDNTYQNNHSVEMIVLPTALKAILLVSFVIDTVAASNGTKVKQDHTTHSILATMRVAKFTDMEGEDCTLQQIVFHLVSPPNKQINNHLQWWYFIIEEYVDQRGLSH